MADTPLVATEIVNTAIPAPQQEGCRQRSNTQQCRHQVDKVSDAVGLPPTKGRKYREFLEDVSQGHDPKTAGAKGLQCRAEVPARQKDSRRNGKKEAGGDQCKSAFETSCVN